MITSWLWKRFPDGTNRKELNAFSPLASSSFNGMFRMPGNLVWSLSYEICITRVSEGASWWTFTPAAKLLFKFKKKWYCSGTGALFLVNFPPGRGGNAKNRTDLIHPSPKSLIILWEIADHWTFCYQQSFKHYYSITLLINHNGEIQQHRKSFMYIESIWNQKIYSTTFISFPRISTALVVIMSFLGVIFNS